MIDSVYYITRSQGMELVSKYHYSKVMPRITKRYVGGFEGKKLVAVMTLGWGVRPLHTIQKLFPSLTTKDYLEIGKMCVADEMPKNSVSHFTSKVIALIKKDMPQVKILFSWADGIMGKAGYVYQASNFFYGGYIWTNAFLDKDNVRIHRRTLQGINSTKKNTKGSIAFDVITKQGYRMLFGKQFRYVFPLCDKREWKKLLKESEFKWTRGDYPKNKDIEFFIKDKDGKRKLDSIEMNTTIHTKENKMLKNQIKLF
tara:strand:- start:1039 stop:1806 length:768 start_codon:yes stop_codon:yes gene_type:complete